ncbi:MAG: aminoacetone oxidase family FAD-binding enzyme [bacterium]
MDNSTDLAIVGGGAAGLACAVAAGRLGLRAVVLEKTERCGKKLALAGGKKGNFTHACGPREMAERFDCDPRVLVPLLKRFSYQRITGFFRSLGIEHRVDDDGCVWPVRSDAVGLVRALLADSLAHGGAVQTQARVTRLLPGQGVELEGGRRVDARNVVLATGGTSYPNTGSSGDAVLLAESAGLATVAWFPALASLATRDDLSALAGATQPKVGMELCIDGKPTRRAVGHFIFAHSHVSGSSVLNLCGYAARALAEGRSVVLRVDWIPDVSAAALAEEFGRARREHPKRLAVTFINPWMPRRLAQLLVVRAGTPADRVMAELTRDEQARLAGALKATDLEIVGTEPIERATATGGGVALSEVDFTTMAARRIAGLYVCGEALDLWGETGGYNLHFAWSSGICAAEAIAGRQLV